MERVKHIAIVGPSCINKEAIVSHLKGYFGKKVHNVTLATSLQLKPGEIPNMDYYHFSRLDFFGESKFAYFVETHEENGVYYGTPWSEVKLTEINGKIIIFNVGIEQALDLRNQLGDNVLIFFLRAELTSIQDQERKSLDMMKKICDYALSYVESANIESAVSSIMKYLNEIQTPQLV